MNKIGIVTVLYNSESVLEEFFTSLENQTYKNFTLYVVDNASPDDSLETAKSLAANVSFKSVILPQSENWGVAKGNNIGISAALKDGSDYVLLANNDTVFPPETIENLLKGMNLNGGDMATPKIYFHGTSRIWCAGGGFSKWRGLTYHIGFGEEDCSLYDSVKEITYSPTCFMLIKASVFDKVGMMDEKYFVYYDDTDFVWRSVMNHHCKLLYIPKSILFHKVSISTGGSSSDFTIYYSTRNNFYFLKKNYRGVYYIISNMYRRLALKRKLKRLSEKQREVVKKAFSDYRKM